MRMKDNRSCVFNSAYFWQYVKLKILSLLLSYFNFFGKKTIFMIMKNFNHNNFRCCFSALLMPYLWKSTESWLIELHVTKVAKIDIIQNVLWPLQPLQLQLSLHEKIYLFLANLISWINRIVSKRKKIQSWLFQK